MTLSSKATGGKTTYQIASGNGDVSHLLGIGQESHCRYMWAPKLPSKPWQAIGTRHRAKPTHSIKHTMTDEELQNFKTSSSWISDIGDKVDTPLSGVDVYVSPNQFFSWRRTEQLASLHANWLEIDTVGHATLDELQQAAIISEVFSQLNDADIPLPTAYNTSGSGGLHLYWIYEGAAAYRWRVNVWREITSKLIAALQGGDLWEVDCGASRDPARVLRLSGSYHSKSGRKATSYTGGESFKFDELANRLGVSAEKPAHLSLAVNNTKSSRVAVVGDAEEKKAVVNTGRHTIGQWWTKILVNVLSHSHRNGVPNGKRDSTIFILYVALRHMRPTEEDAYEALVSINEDLGEPLSSGELTQYLRTARSTHYKYKKATVADYLERQLGIDSDFLYSSTPTKLTADQVKARRKDGAALTAHAKRSSTLEAIKSAIATLSQTSTRVTQSAVACAVNKSARTVRRYWAEALNSTEAIRSPSIYSPL